jgi:hypothetical protein
MKTYATWMLLALVVGLSGGCRNGQWFPPPGPMNQQQALATIHDPYPQNDIAPYEAASRPPDYQTPLPQAERARIHRDAVSGYRTP